MMLFTSDEKYNVLIAQRELALERGDLESALTYGRSAIARGDELIASLGGQTKFAPLAKAVEDIRALYENRICGQ